MAGLRGAWARKGMSKAAHAIVEGDAAIPKGQETARSALHHGVLWLWAE
jgi:hypothetical protein